MKHIQYETFREELFTELKNKGISYPQHKNEYAFRSDHIKNSYKGKTDFTVILMNGYRQYDINIKPHTISLFIVPELFLRFIKMNNNITIDFIESIFGHIWDNTKTYEFTTEYNKILKKIELLEKIEILQKTIKKSKFRSEKLMVFSLKIFITH